MGRFSTCGRGEKCRSGLPGSFARCQFGASQSNGEMPIRRIAGQCWDVSMPLKRQSGVAQPCPPPLAAHQRATGYRGSGLPRGRLRLPGYIIKPARCALTSLSSGRSQAVYLWPRTPLPGQCRYRKRGLPARSAAQPAQSGIDTTTGAPVTLLRRTVTSISKDDALTKLFLK